MPHAQTKSGTSASPASLEALLERLADINIEGVSGTSLEADGLIHIAVEHGREAEVHDLLGDYHPKWTTDLYVEEIDNQGVAQPGVLLGIIQRARQAHPDRAIDTVLTGVSSGTFFVQVTFVGSDWSNDPPP